MSRALRHLARELRELGPVRTAFRIGWEARLRSRWFELADRPVPEHELASAEVEGAVSGWRERPVFATPARVSAIAGPHLDDEARARLLDDARAAARGEILLFGHTRRSGGTPVDWHRDPFTGQALDPTRHWSRALREVHGDPKSVWEAARFPHAYTMGRAATFFPGERTALATALTDQISSFIDESRQARGVHWASGQEMVFRLFAWVFAFHTLLDDADPAFLRRLARHVYESAVHVERHIDYARYAVHNNHLVSESIGLLLAAHLFPRSRRAEGFIRTGTALLDEAIATQFYPDGGYIQQSHNYHRVALQDLSWAFAILRAGGKPIPRGWRAAADRSIDFLHAQQAPDGTLPNYGNNDGALVSPLASRPYADFRPALGALAVAARGTRLYPPGPWDEEAAWFVGALPAPRGQLAPRVSRSFAHSGYHVLRGHDAGTFAVFRCGTLHDRFTQIDMLHLDVFWRGHDVLVDAGSYRYGGAPIWHAHFLGTRSHNTIVVGGEEQMLHLRQFKTLYPARAETLSIDRRDGWSLVVGEHHGYGRVFPGVVHRRAVLFVPDDLWVVVDSVSGVGAHETRLQWLAGLGPHRVDEARNTFVLETSAGAFEVSVHDADATPLPLDVVAGGENPPRGWLARRYAEKVPVPSIHVVGRSLPTTRVSVLGAGPVSLVRDGDRLLARGGTSSIGFALARGVPIDVRA